MYMDSQIQAQPVYVMFETCVSMNILVPLCRESSVITPLATLLDRNESRRLTAPHGYLPFLLRHKLGSTNGGKAIKLATKSNRCARPGRALHTEKERRKGILFEDPSGSKIYYR